MVQEFDHEKQIDRACAAQSSELLPKKPLSQEEKQAKHARIEAAIKAQFNQ